MVIKRKIENKTIGGVKVVARRCAMVKLPRAERGNKRNIIMWTEGQGRKRKEIRRLEQ
jgi:hypothetical protein